MTCLPNMWTMQIYIVDVEVKWAYITWAELKNVNITFILLIAIDVFSVDTSNTFQNYIKVKYFVSKLALDLIWHIYIEVWDCVAFSMEHP